MRHEPIEETYFNWLCSKVMQLNGPPTPSTTYFNLFRILHSTEFIDMIPNDDNRVEDGLELREYFLRETGYKADPDWTSTGCSILEMLIAFANRAEFDSYTDSKTWFWRFLENLDLIRFRDDHVGSFDEVHDILDRFVYRSYSYSGRGGLFPLDHAQRDQRNVEIAYQFFEYREQNPV